MAAKKKSRSSSTKKSVKKTLKKTASKAKKVAKKASKTAKKAARKVAKKTTARVTKSAKKVAKKATKRINKAIAKHRERQAKKKAEAALPTVLQIGLIHEFGAPKASIPSRSFIRDWVDENRDEHRKQLRAIAQQVLKGKLTQEQGLKRFGVLAEAQVKKRIAAGIPPALKAATEKRKGSSKPLIHTGQLRSSITHKLSRRKPGVTSL